MHFTATVEQLAVIPVTTRITMGRFSTGVSPGMRQDAFKICTDEAWHAQFSYDFIVDQAAARKMPMPMLTEPDFVRTVAALRETVDTSMRELFDVFFAVVTETIVSRLLRDIPRDIRLSAPVREVVADHAADEARHHAYFKSLLKLLWPQLSVRERSTLGVLVPTLTEAFLRPDASAAKHMLWAAGFGREEVAEVVRDCYCSSSYVELRAAAGTVAAFREADAFADQPIFDAFASRGMIPT